MYASGSIFNKLSEYFNENSKKVNLSLLDKLQIELELDITGYEIHENEFQANQRKLGVNTMMAKYNDKQNGLIKDIPYYTLAEDGETWVYNADGRRPL